MPGSTVRAATAALGVAAATLVASPPATATTRPAPRASAPQAGAAASRPRLPDLVTLRAVRRHQRNLQRIADAHGGNRAAGQPGGAATVRYLLAELRKAGYRPTTQPFSFLLWRKTGPSALHRIAPARKRFAAEIHFTTLRFAAKGDVTAGATAVDPAAAGKGSGCEPGDFKGFPHGGIALIRRGGCRFSDKADAAADAGAAAAVIYQQPGTAGPVSGSLGSPSRIPVLGVTKAVGEQLVRQARAGGLRLRVRTRTVVRHRHAANVIADTPRGDPGNVVVVGAHHDSVLEGPGINDNGSGTATVLAIAQRIGELGAAQRNRVRFIFFDAEELGLLGSRYYVDSLSRTARERIAAMLNFDMLGSPNHARFVYDGDGSSGRNTLSVPAGSARIERVFTRYFASRGLDSDPTPFNGRSDYAPFAEAGIPVGGLFSGAGERKTRTEAVRYGGTAGRAYDPCYHAACDTYDNVHLTGLDQMSDAAAAATEWFAATATPRPRSAARSG